MAIDTDNDILNGGPPPSLSQPVTPAPTTEAAANNQVQSDIASTPSPTTTLQSTGGPQEAIPNPNPMPQPPGTPSVWKNMAFGALFGALAGAGGRTFGQGAARGLAATAGLQQRQFENRLRAQQFQFASVAAADSHIRAVKEAQLVDVQTEEAKLNLQQQRDATLVLDKALGLPGPSGTIEGDNPKDLNDGATGALRSEAAKSPDGRTIPAVAAMQSPIGGSQKTHIIDYRTPPSAQELQQNPNGFRSLVDEAYKADGKILTDAEWNTGAGALQPGARASAPAMISQVVNGQQKMVMAAYQRLYTPFGGQKLEGGGSPEDIASKNAGTAAMLHQQADAYDKGQDTNPTVSKILHMQADNFDSAVENARSRASKAKAQTTTEQAPAQAEAGAKEAAAKTIAENTGAAGEAKISLAAGEERAKQAADLKSTYYAVNPQGQTVQVTGAQVAQPGSGLTAVRPVTAKEISTDQHDIKVLNDIQVKSDAVKQAASAMDNTSWGDSLRAARYLSDHPNTTAEQLIKSSTIGSMTPQAQAYTLAILSLRESAMGLQKVLTGSARNNEQQINALQATLPGVEPNSNIVSQKLQNFDQNLGMLRQGLPENTGVAINRGATSTIYASAPGKPRLKSTDGGKTWVASQ